MSFRKGYYLISIKKKEVYLRTYVGPGRVDELTGFFRLVLPFVYQVRALLGNLSR